MFLPVRNDLKLLNFLFLLYMVHCPECDSESVIKNGKSGFSQKYKCKDCGNNFLDTPTDEVKVQEEETVVNEEIQQATPAVETPTEATEETSEETPAPTEKVRSWKAKHVWFRAHYKDKFDEPKHSKKYGFYFNSWYEYFTQKYEIKKAAKLAEKTKETPVSE